MTSRLSVLGFVLILGGLTVSGCGLTTPQRTEAPTIAPTEVPEKAPDAERARDAALGYIREEYGEQAPAGDLAWTKEVVTPEGLVGSSTFEYTAGDWVITISFPVVAPQATIYGLTVANQITRFEWEGDVDAAGQVTETIAPAAGQRVACWYGSVVSAPDDAVADDYLALLPEEARRAVGLTGAHEALEADIEALRDSGIYAYFWGELDCDVADYAGCQLVVARLRPEGPEGP